MALGGRGFVSVGAVVACCALAAACTSEPPPVITPAPTSAATTPPESQIERQMRLDYEAAEKAYGPTSCGAGRHQAGGIAKVTPTLKATATGDYLLIVLRARDTQDESGMALKRNNRILGVVPNGWQETNVGLTELRRQQRVRFFDSDRHGRNSDRERAPMCKTSLSRMRRALEGADVSITEGQIV